METSRNTKSPSSIASTVRQRCRSQRSRKKQFVPLYVPQPGIKGARGSAKFRCPTRSSSFVVVGGRNPLHAWFFLRNLGQQHPIANTTGPANSCAHGDQQKYQVTKLHRIDCPTTLSIAKVEEETIRAALRSPARHQGGSRKCKISVPYSKLFICCSRREKPAPRLVFLEKLGPTTP